MNIARENIAAMRKFVKENGGSVRFDVFAQEHLAGERGFYSRHIDLSEEHAPVSTPMNALSPYRSAYATLVVKNAVRWA